MLLTYGRLIGRKSEWHLSEAEHSHRSGTQLAHSNSPHPAFRIQLSESKWNRPNLRL